VPAAKADNAANTAYVKLCSAATCGYFWRTLNVTLGIYRLDHDSGRHDDQAIALALGTFHLLDHDQSAEAWIRWAKAKAELAAAEETGDVRALEAALEEQRNGEWRYLEFLQVTSLITAEIFMREIPGGMRAR
jgi:hypothetical protein